VDEDRAKRIYERAVLLFQHNRYTEASVLFRELHEAFPENRDIVYGRARCLAALGYVNEALDLCDRLSEELGDSRGDKLAKELLAAQAGPAEAPPPETQEPGGRRVPRWARVRLWR